MIYIRHFAVLHVGKGFFNNQNAFFILFQGEDREWYTAKSQE